MQAIKYANTRDMPRDEWLSLRRQGIGGSDAAAILGMSPWKSAYAVYMDKLGMLPEKEPTEALWWGTKQEDLVAKRFEELTGMNVRRLNALLSHPEHDWMLANIDRRIVGERAGLECKTTEVYNPTDFAAGEVPPTYYWQCMHYLAVTGWDKWYLAVKVGNGSAFHIYDIDRNEEHIALLIDAEERFWNDNVLAHEAPLPSGSENDGEIIYAMAGEDDAECADLSGCADALDMLAVLKSDKKTLETRISALEQQVQLSMDDATSGVCGAWKVTWRTQTRRTVDSKRLKAEKPDIYEKYSKASESRPFNIRRNKDAG